MGPVEVGREHDGDMDYSTAKSGETRLWILGPAADTEISLGTPRIISSQYEYPV